jgi:ubiquinone/menaquinone biosynthesis C-methylase UbiE
VEEAEHARIASAEDRHWWYSATRALMADLLRPWLRGGPDVLDAGCGTGATGAWLAQHGRVTGVDVSAEALGLLAVRHPEVRTVKASVESLPFADHSFDIVVGVTVLYQLDHPERAVAEWTRVLRPGGVMLAIEPAIEMFRRDHDKQVGTVRRFRVAELAAYFEQAGAEVRRATYAHCHFVPAAAALAMLHRIRPARRRPRSDLDRNALSGVFKPASAAERRLLRRVDLPVGVSAVVLAT